MKNTLVILIICFTTSIIFGQITDPVATEVWEPVPRVVTSPSDKFVPSDAVVLFDGKDLSAWKSAKSDEKAKWKIKDDAMTVKPGTGDIETKQSFGSIQLHIEWRSPKKVKSEGQGRGNSGVFFQKRYEVQVLDNYENKTYPNGQAGSIYKQYMPLVNACRAPGEWQSYDIIFMAPEFNADGIRVRSGYLTVFHNGVLIQNHAEVQGTTEYIGLPKNIAHGDAPIMLQDHGNLVSYRNIWVREL